MRFGIPGLRRLAAILSLAALAACVQTGLGPSPFPPVPAPLAEEMPKPPVSAEPLRWRPGFWDWTGRDYAWTAGEYVPMAGTTDRWRPGWWSNGDGDGQGWVWMPPGWVR